MSEIEDMNEMEELRILEEKALSLIPIIIDYIDDEYKKYLEELISHCEIGLAYEEIATTVIYLDIKITPQQYEKFNIEKILKHVNKDILSRIKKQVV